MFIDERFPHKTFPGTQGSVGFLTDASRNDGGVDTRNQLWTNDLRTWDVAKSVQTREEYETILHFFLTVAKGQANGFRFKDLADYKLTDTHQTDRPQLGVGDGATTTFQIKKVYKFGTYEFERDVKKPVADTVKIYIDNARIWPDHATLGWSVATSSGMVTFDSAAEINGKSIYVDCEFDFPVRFTNDKLSHSWIDFNKFKSRISLIEDRNI